MDAALCLALVADPTAGATVCPKAGLAAAAANVTNVTNKRKSRLRARMTSSSSWALPYFTLEYGKPPTSIGVPKLDILGASVPDTRGAYHPTLTAQAMA
jgi:hypothetical protein